VVALQWPGGLGSRSLRSSCLEKFPIVRASGMGWILYLGYQVPCKDPHENHYCIMHNPEPSSPHCIVLLVFIVFAFNHKTAPFTNNLHFHSSVTLSSKTFTYQIACSLIPSLTGAVSQIVFSNAAAAALNSHPKSPGHLEAPETVSHTQLPHPPHVDPTIRREHPELCCNETNRSVTLD